MKCAIMQPTFLGWLGFYQLIANVDKFVWLDDVAFEKSSWQSRNRILFNGKVQWLSCSIVRAPLGTPIHKINVHNSEFQLPKLAKTVSQAYAKAPFKQVIEPIIEYLSHSNQHSLAKLNYDLSNIICQMLQIETPKYTSSTLNCKGDRSSKLVNICHKLDCDEFFSAAGSKHYIEGDGVLSNAGIRVEYQNFIPPIYPQCHTKVFHSHLSIIDSLANCGINQVEDMIKRKCYA